MGYMYVAGRCHTVSVCFILLLCFTGSLKDFDKYTCNVCVMG